MDNRQFDALVRRLEPQAAAAPGRYQTRVLLLALLGYAYIGLVLAVLVAAVAGCVWLMFTTRSGNAALFKVAVALLVFAGIVARALWVRFEPPAGRRLTREEAPALFAEAGALRLALRAPKADVVLLNDEYNASVSQIPRLGIFGFPRNYLVVGLPLLEAMSPEQVRAVLAHEFAHLSHAHGKFASWIYRVRMSWYQLMTRLDQDQHRAAAIFRWFFDWYAPYFGAYTFVLMRRHEYQADRLAASVVGLRPMAQTLVDMNVRGDFLSQRFWPAIWQEPDTREAPPADVYSRLAAQTRSPLPDADVDAWLVAALKRRTDTDDTHPSLRDRLTALVGPTDDAGRFPNGTALRGSRVFDAVGADRYLGASHARLAAELGRTWRTEVEDAWKRRREEIREARESFAALTAKASAGSLDLEERWRLASLTEELQGAEAALPLYEALMREDPEHLSATFSVGRLLLRGGDESGVALIERVMERDPDAVLVGCQIVYGFLAGEGRLEEADRYRERATSRSALLHEAQHERDTILASDTYVPAELPEDVVRRLVSQLDAIEGVKRVYLARKVLRHFAEEAPLHVLVVVPTGAFWTLGGAQRKQQQRAEAIAGQLELPAGVNAFGAVDASAPYLKPIRKVTGSLIYDAARRKAERRARPEAVQAA